MKKQISLLFSMILILSSFSLAYNFTSNPTVNGSRNDWGSTLNTKFNEYELFFNNSINSSTISNYILTNLTYINNNINNNITSLRTEINNNILNNITYTNSNINNNATYIISLQRGNTTTEIRNQFSGSSNISIVNGVISVNASFGSAVGTITGAGNLNYIPLFNGTTSITNSSIKQESSGLINITNDLVIGSGIQALDIYDSGSYLYLNSTNPINILPSLFIDGVSVATITNLNNNITSLRTEVNNNILNNLTYTNSNINNNITYVNTNFPTKSNLATNLSLYYLNW